VIEALLNLLFNKTDIINYRNTDEGELYLRRWFIWPRKPADLRMVPRLYLHKFYTGDSDRHLHDHPWSFRSLILRGGYREYSYNPEWLKYRAATGREHSLVPKLRSKWYGPGSYLKRGASWAHSVKLQTLTDGEVVPCWSLVLTSVKSRSWGFHTEGGWCWWRFYTEGACVCYDNPNETLPGKGSSKLEQERAAKPKE
jgi:hypothetical protein